MGLPTDRPGVCSSTQIHCLSWSTQRTSAMQRQCTLKSCLIHSVQPCSFRRVSSSSSRACSSSRTLAVACRAERREYYDFKDMPPLPLTVSRIYIPSLDYTVVDRSTQQQRQASLAIFYDIYKDDQYQCKLTRRSAITALCMFDRDDVSEARNNPGDFPNIDLLHRVYNDGLELDFVVDEINLK